jgi:hypothetical protein
MAANVLTQINTAHIEKCCCHAPGWGQAPWLCCILSMVAWSHVPILDHMHVIKSHLWTVQRMGTALARIILCLRMDLACKWGRPSSLLKSSVHRTTQHVCEQCREEVRGLLQVFCLEFLLDRGQMSWPSSSKTLQPTLMPLTCLCQFGKESLLGPFSIFI